MEVEFSLPILSFLIGVGLMAGFCGGLLGIGGSIVIIPALVLWFGGDGQHLFQATAMMVNFFVVAPAVVRHIAAEAYDKPMLKGMIPSAVVGIIIGVWLSEFQIFRGSGQGRLQIIFATFLVYIFFQNLTWLIRGKPERQPNMGDGSRRGLSGALVVGTPAGVLSGLLGIGGGLFMVPAQQSFLKLPLKMSIANSATTILFSSVVGAIYKAQGLSQHGTSWSDALLMAAMLAPTAMIGAWIGAAKSHIWPVRTVRIAFALLLVFSIYRLYTIGWMQLKTDVTTASLRMTGDAEFGAVHSQEDLGIVRRRCERGRRTAGGEHTALVRVVAGIAHHAIAIDRNAPGLAPLPRLQYTQHLGRHRPLDVAFRKVVPVLRMA